MAASTPEASQVVLITGSGRSGTSWLGEMMRTNLACSYKYEPFPPHKTTPYHQWAEDMLTGDPAEHRAEFFRIASHGHLDIDRPPFNSKTLGPTRVALPFLHKAASRVGQLKPLFTAAARCDVDGAPILLKDVWLPNTRVPRFVDVLDADLVTIIRHPHASVASVLRGIDMGVFHADLDEKRDRVRTLHAGFSEFADPNGLIDRVDKLDAVSLEALRWRLEAEPTALFAEKYAKGQIVVYEHLVTDPLATITKVFDALGWPVGSGTRDFIRASQTTDTKQGSAQYFSTNRDPTEALQSWREHVTDHQLDLISAVVEPSPLMHLWPDF